MSKIKLSENFIKDRVKLALTEDLFPNGDITTNLLNNNKTKIYKKKKQKINKYFLFGLIFFNFVPLSILQKMERELIVKIYQN